MLGIQTQVLIYVCWAPFRLNHFPSFKFCVLDAQMELALNRSLQLQAQESPHEKYLLSKKKARVDKYSSKQESVLNERKVG